MVLKNIHKPRNEWGILNGPPISTELCVCCSMATVCVIFKFYVLLFFLEEKGRAIGGLRPVYCRIWWTEKDETSLLIQSWSTSCFPLLVAVLKKLWVPKSQQPMHVSFLTPLHWNFVLKYFQAGSNEGGGVWNVSFVGCLTEETYWN